MLLLNLTNKKRGRNIITQIIEEKAESKKSILIDLEDLADDIILKEIETDLQESIAKLSCINSSDALKTKKENRKEKKLKQKLERIWNDSLSRKYWTSQMKLNECDISIYRFYPLPDNNY